MDRDVAVIGGGPAGLSAAVNIRARGKSVLVISNPIEDNPLWRSERVDNHVGMPAISGAELLTAMRRHAEAAGAVFQTGQVLSAMAVGNEWYLSVGSEVVSAAAVVLAAGVVRGKKLPGEEALLGRGVSYCATCDGMLYRGRRVAVLGYSDAAKEEAAYLEGIGCQVVYLDKPRDCAIEGEGRVERIVTAGRTEEVAGVFILRPAVFPDTLFSGLALENGYVTVDRTMATNLSGVFAAGDCTGGPLQVSKAVGEGLIAGQSAAAWVSAVVKNIEQ